MSGSNYILIFVAVYNIVFAFFVFKKNKRSVTNQTFAIFVLLLGLWSASVVILNIVKSVFVGSIVVGLGLSMGAIFPLFAKNYPSSNKKPSLIFYLPFLIPVIIYLILAPFNLILKEIKIHYNTLEPAFSHTLEPVFGPLYILMVVYALSIVVYGFISLIKRYKESKGIERLQMKYLFVGIFVFFAVIITFNVVLPLFKIYQLIIFGPLASIFFVGSTTYAITRYRLMDIRLIIKRGLVTFLSFIVIVFFVWGIMAVVGNLIGRKPDPRLTVVGLVSVVLANLVFSLVKSFFEHLANKYFFTSLYNYQTAFEKLARELTHTINLDQIIDSIIESIKDAMRLDRAGVLLLNEQTSNYQVQKTIGFAADNGISLVRNNFLTSHLLKTRQPVIFQELESWPENSDSERSEIGKLKFNMKHIEAALCLPLIIRDKLIGIIVLGNKISKDAYTKEDLRLLDSISHQASIAVENARLYNNMEEIVDSQTKDIKAKARHLEKLLKMRSEFLDTTSHQLRTPTSVLIGILEMAVKGELDMLPQEKKQKQLEGAYLKAKKLEQIVSDLLRASELDSASFRLKLEDFREINLEEFFNRIITFKALEAEKQGVEVCLAKPLPCSKIFGEKIFLDEAIGNLIDNAIKYTPSKNKKTDAKGKIIISCAKDDKNIHIKIQDNGIGIPKEEMGKLFEKFNRASNAKEMYTDGTGLGLFIVKKIIEGHGGKIGVESGLGQGSTFIASLPLQPSLKNI